MIGVILIAIGVACFAWCCLAILDQLPQRLMPRRAWQMGAVLVVGSVLLLVGQSASAQSPRIPEASVQYRRAIEAASVEFFGLQASPARLAAQLHQESRFRPQAASRFAVGIAQFTPATAAWLPKVCPEVGPFDPWDPGQAIRAAECYNRHLYDSIKGAATQCDRWAFTKAAYNGGLGWVNRDRRMASATGADPARWFGHTELHTRRADWARRENRDYVRRILLRLEPAYIAAGWHGRAVCSGVL